MRRLVFAATLMASLQGCAAAAYAVPLHVQNWLYACSTLDETCSQALNVGIAPAWMAAHADWNEVYYSAADDPTARLLAQNGARHIVIYVDPNISPYCPVPAGYGSGSANLPENGANCTGTVAQYLHAEAGGYGHAFAHDARGNRLVNHADGFYHGEAQEPFYIGDPGVQTAFRTATSQNRYATDVFEDDAGGAYNCVMDGNGDCSSTYGMPHTAPPLCDYTGGYWCYKFGETAREWDASSDPQDAYLSNAVALSNASLHPVIGNDGVATDSFDVRWVRSRNVEGAMWENAWQRTLGTSGWIAKADAVLLYHSLHAYVIEFDTDESALFFQIASHWIVYDPLYSVEALAERNPARTQAGQGDTTFPEESVVPTTPLVATPAGNDVQTFEVAPGLFVREYAACYENGVSIGTCAAVINTATSAQPIGGLTQEYGHVLVHDMAATWAAGGTPIWSTAVPTSIAAESGLILAQ